MEKVEIQINLDTILKLLTSQRLVTTKDGVEITICNPEVWEISEEEDLETIVKWRKLVKELSKLTTK